MNLELVVFIVVPNLFWKGGGGGADDKFVILFVKKCLRSAIHIALGLQPRIPFLQRG